MPDEYPVNQILYFIGVKVILKVALWKRHFTLIIVIIRKWFPVKIIFMRIMKKQFNDNLHKNCRNGTDIYQYKQKHQQK